MGLFGNLFEKKNCDVCGEEIKLLGNRKLEDGNLCKNCASKLSPWFDERRHSTVSQIKDQLAYREANQSKVSSFRSSQVYGQGSKRLYVDNTACRFTIATEKELSGGNPDILDFSQARSCDLDIKENRHEEKRTVDGKSVSYVPPRYKYSYDFYVTIRVDNPYFDDMKFQINSFSVDTGNTCMTSGGNAGWKINTNASLRNNMNINKYNECISTGDQIKNMVYGWMGSSAQPQMQGYPQQGMQQGFAQPQMQGYPQQNMQQGFVQPQMQGYPQQGMQQGFAQPQMQGYPQQGMQQGFAQPQMQGYPQQNTQQGFAQPQMQAAAPAAAMAGAAMAGAAVAGAQITCPYCDATITPVNGKCPVCEGTL
ncbi:MAG: DUF4428 domain-containing protein [Lachnospiraceae bacterium]|nr:DUF4428 domain-containing protein [Lachnospiraceae bacterium]